MYYETKQGDDESKLNCSPQSKPDEESEAIDEDFDSKSRNIRKRRRNEASMLQDESEQLRNNHRPKRAAGISAKNLFFYFKLNLKSP